jgi:hypothetical protein
LLEDDDTEEGDKERGAEGKCCEYEDYLEKYMVQLDDVTEVVGFINLPFSEVLYREVRQGALSDGSAAVMKDCRCTKCHYMFTVGDRGSYCSGCVEKTEKHYLCEVCIKKICLGIPTIEEYQKVDTLHTIPVCCVRCKGRGYYLKVSMGNEVSRIANPQWDFGEDVCKVAKYNVCGMHQKKGVFCTWILSANLMKAIVNKEKTRNRKYETCYRTDAMGREESDLYRQYCEMTEGIFKCYNCNFEKRNEECCMVSVCAWDCKFKLCRNCVATKINNTYHGENGEDYKKGILTCPICMETAPIWHPIAKRMWCVAAQKE